MSLDITKIRQDFPILQQQVHGKPLIYLDSAGTAQKPQVVIDAVAHYYQAENANIHRGVHSLSQRATDAYEQVRESVRRFINAKHVEEIIFVSGTTAAINLLAQSYGRPQLQAGDEILLTQMEHHGNIVPWQVVAEQTGAQIRVIPVLPNGELDLAALPALLTTKTKLLALTHISNVLGTINPVKEIIAMAHAQGVPVVIDGAQAIVHEKIDVQAIDCDFYVFSGHKLYGPTGIGVLYGKKELLKKMPPYQTGGGMITEVSFAKTDYQDLPGKFEPGTPNIAGVIGLGAAINYITQLGWNNVAEHEQRLLTHVTAALQNISELTIIGNANPKAAVISFTLGDIHAHDIGTILDHYGIAIRAGHHCAMPLLEAFGLPALARASFAIYNTTAEIDALAAALHEVKRIFQ